MYKITNLKLKVDFKKDDLNSLVARKLKVSASDVFNSQFLKLSLDARRKSDIFYVATISFECKAKLNLKRLSDVSLYEKKEPKKLKFNQSSNPNIVVVGSGPSGLFAGLTLAESGANVTILERGYSMEKRIIAVNNLFENGILDEKCNIQFGEGGAGTFSDGKLNTGIKSEHIEKVLQTFVECGADDEILYSSKPHIGTDILSKVIVNMRKRLESLGSKILFEHKLVDVNIECGKVKSIEVETIEGRKTYRCDMLILAIGHSSRDTIRMLFEKNLALKQKPFSMGYRIEHLQKDLNVSQYGENHSSLLPPADYHLSEHLKDGRGVYTFCMCPGGVVVPAMSEKNTIVTNGMSYSKRDGVNCNSALLCTIETKDFPSEDVLSGIDLQEKYERYAYTKNNSYKATVQRVGDFLMSRPTTRLGKVVPTFKPDYVLGDVSDMLPEFVVSSIKEGILALDKKLKGFADPDAILTGVETRSSAPYQVIRGVDMMSNIENLYMIGEGAGFAGGIVSSAVEGIKCANVIIEKSNQ